MKNQDLLQVNFIRAFAALAVTVFHLFCGNPNLFPTGNTLKSIFSFGYLGVELFFLLSGFIICYALPEQYNILRHFKTFILKRVTRIEPPYLISVIGLITLGKLAEHFNHVPFNISFKNLLFHIGYLCNFNIGTYYNVVYWTLGIEFQFYLLIAFIFPLLNSKSTSVILLSFLLLIGLSFINKSNWQLIFPFLPIFCMGFLTFLYKFKKSISGLTFVTLALIFSGIIIYRHDPPVLLATIAGTGLLCFWNYSNPLISYFSKISYSLYLTHVWLGGKVINLGLRFVYDDWHRYLLFIFALLISIAGAHLFNWIVETPSIKLAKRYRYASDTN